MFNIINSFNKNVEYNKCTTLYYILIYIQQKNLKMY